MKNYLRSISLSKTMENIIAIKTNCFKGFSPEITFEGIRNAGFDNVEVSLSLGSNTGIDRTKSPIEIEKAKENLNRLKLNVMGVGGHVDITNPDNDNAFIQNIELAKTFGAHYIVISVGSNSEKQELSNEFVANRIKRFIPILEKNNVVMVLETHWKHATGMKLKPICELVNSPYCKICYDTGNVVFYGELTKKEIIADFKNSLSQIGYVHLKDKLGKTHDWNFPALGMGIIPLEEIITIIKENNLSCPIVAEVEYINGLPQDEAQAKEYVKESYQFLKKHI